MIKLFWFRRKHEKHRWHRASLRTTDSWRWSVRLLRKSATKNINRTDRRPRARSRTRPRHHTSRARRKRRGENTEATLKVRATAAIPTGIDFKKHNRSFCSLARSLLQLSMYLLLVWKNANTTIIILRYRGVCRVSTSRNSLLWRYLLRMNKNFLVYDFS